MNKMRRKNSFIYTSVMLVSMILVSCLAFGCVWAYFSDKQFASGGITMGRLNIDLKDNATSVTELVTMDNILPGQYIMGAKDSYKALTIDLSDTNINTFLRVKVDVTLNDIIAIDVFNILTDDKWVMHYDGYSYPTLDDSLGSEATVYEAPALTNQTLNIKLQLKPATSNAHMNLSGTYRVTVEAIQADYLNSETATTTYTITELADIWTTSAHNQEIFIVEDGVITGLSDYAKNNLTTIVLPSTTTSIGANAFSGCENLTSIVIPDSVTEIGEGAFQNCTSLKSVTIPDGVTSIEQNTFEGCTSLTTVVMPDSVANIKYKAFKDCKNLTNIVLSSSLESISGQGFYNTGITSIELPEGLTTIGASAFTNSKITEIYIPASVNNIEGAVSSGLTNLVVDPNNPVYTSRDVDGTECNCVVEISTNTLIATCTTSTIPSFVTALGSEAFSSYSASSLVISANITNIATVMRYSRIDSLIVDEGNSVYTSRDSEGTECNVIIEKATNTLIIGTHRAVIPNTVTKIADRAFCGKYNTSITIPASVVEIGKNVFAYSDRLNTIIVDKNNPVYTSRDSEGNECNAIIEKSTNTLIASCSTTVIPDTVTTLSSSSFYGNRIYAGTLTIPASVTKIEHQAFYSDVYQITNIVFEDPNGWVLTRSAISSTIRDIDLSDSAKNVTYLNSTYVNYVWTKE